jgi:hypothetical protein
MSRKTLLTARDLERMPDDDSVQLELDDAEGETGLDRRLPHRVGDRSEGESSGRFRNLDQERTLRPGDTLDSPELLPGFSIPVADLFAD